MDQGIEIADDVSKEERIKKEINRITRLLKQVPKEKLKVADGVIKRVSFMAITLEDLEDDINEFGTTEPFSQSEGITYTRERPAARMYNTTIKNYVTACKQLFDLLPEGKPPAAQDELAAFLQKKGAKK